MFFRWVRCSVMPCGLHVVISGILAGGILGFRNASWFFRTYSGPSFVIVYVYVSDGLRRLQHISCCVNSHRALLSKLCLFLFGCLVLVVLCFWSFGFCVFVAVCVVWLFLVLFALIHGQLTGLCKGPLALFCSHPMGLLLFPVAEMCFFRCGNFLGCKAGLSLLLVFFLPRPVFFSPRTGFFPPRTVFSRCLQNAFFSAAKMLLCCCKVFFLLLWIFPAAKRHFLLAFFPAAETAFSRCKAFFSCCQTCFFPFWCFFPAANLCFFARCAKTRS